MLDDLDRLNFEDKIWLVFTIISILNIKGTFKEKEYLITNSEYSKRISNNIFLFTLIISFFIYLYFLHRNHLAYIDASSNQKNLYKVKMLGSILLIIGVICLIYFQTNQTSLIDSPTI